MHNKKGLEEVVDLSFAGIAQHQIIRESGNRCWWAQLLRQLTWGESELWHLQHQTLHLLNPTHPPAPEWWPPLLPPFLRDRKNTSVSGSGNTVPRLLALVQGEPRGMERRKLTRRTDSSALPKISSF